MTGTVFSLQTLPLSMTGIRKATIEVTAANLKNTIMKTENWDSEKDLNANPESELNTNKPVTKPERFPESRQAKDEEEKRRNRKRDADVEQLADDVAGSVGERETGSNPSDIAGVSDIDRGMRRSRRK